VKQIGLLAKPVDRAPKRFAAFVGVVFLPGVLIFSLTCFILTSKIVASIMLVFAAWRAFLAFAQAAIFTASLTGLKG